MRSADPGTAHRERRRLPGGLASTAVLLQVVLGALLLVSAVRNRPDAAAPIASSSAQPATVTLETGLPIASAQARLWRADAALAAVTAYIYWPRVAPAAQTSAAPGDGWTVYVFASGRQALSVYVNRRTGGVVTQSAVRWREGLERRLDLTSYPVGSDISVLIAKLEAGAAYRAACPAHRFVTMVTASVGAAGDGRSVSEWVVSYADDREPGRAEILFRVDAGRGSVVAATDTAAGCAG